MLALAFNSQPEIDGRSDLTRSDTVGGFGLCLFFLFFQLNATVAYAGLSLTVLVFAFQAKTWTPVLERDPVAVLFLLSVIYLPFYSIWAMLEFPESADAQRTAVLIWLHWLLFIPVGWQLFRHIKHINLFLPILATGLLIRILVNLNWADLGNILTLERTGFGMAETVFSPIVGSMVLGFLMLAPRMIIQQPNTPRWFGLLKISACFIYLAVFLESLVLSQTRGAWLAAALVFPVALLVRYKSWLGKHKLFSGKSIVVLMLLVAMVGLFLHKNYETIFKRVNSEQVNSVPEVVKKQWEGQEVLMTTSVGYRKILWGIGWRKWQERPFFGWGPGSTELLLKKENNPILSQSVTLNDGSIETLHISHLHNLYLEFMVRFGIVGTLLLLALPVVLMVKVWEAQTKGRIPWDYACFLFAGWAFLAIMVLFDFQLFKFAWRNYCLIWAALTYAVQLENLSLRNQRLMNSDF